MSALPVHPGYVLDAEYRALFGLTVTQLAKDLGISRPSMSKILNGHTGISADMALRLSHLFRDTTPEIWLHLQMKYDLAIARTKWVKT